MNRGNIIKKNLSFGLIFKIISMGLSYVLIPITLNYLGEKNYGVWVTIFSILSWIYNFDVGIGVGLRNKLTEALTLKDIKLAKEYIATAYMIVLIITLVILFLGSLGIGLINLNEILNIDFISENYLKKVLFISFIFTMGNFVLGLFRQLLYATHKSSLIGLTNIVYQGLIITMILLVKKNTNNSSLAILAFIYGISNLIVGVLFSTIIFYKKSELIPNIKYINLKRIKDITGIGIEFFIIQICMIIIFTTDNLIITKLLGPESVAGYTIILKVFQTFILIASIILTPFWTLYTDAYMKKDIKWITKTIKFFNILFLLLIVSVSLAALKIDLILNLWIGKRIIYPKYLILLCGSFALIRVYGDIYFTFLNGIGKIRIQLTVFIVGALLNIPLSIYFVKNLNLGSSGVILATNICILPFIVIMPIQCFYELKKIK